MSIQHLEYYHTQAIQIFKKMKVVSSVTFCDDCKILKTESRTMVNSLRTLKMPLFLVFLRGILKSIIIIMMVYQKKNF